MDERLLRAACWGDAASLAQLLREKPFILADTAMINSNENILNTAIKSHHLQFSIQLARSCPLLLTVQDRDGVRPLDVASAYGLLEMVRQLLILTPNPAEICRLPGRDGKAAIHHASINGRVDVIDELMNKCPDCIGDVTSFGETALHLAVKHYKFEALKCLLQWLGQLGTTDDVLNRKDKDENTILHHAASRKQLETVELLLNKNNSSIRNSIEVDAVNSKGLAALDIVTIFLETSSDLRLKTLLEEAGQGSSSSRLATPSPGELASPSHHHQQDNNTTERPKDFKEMVEYFKFNWRRDSASELRNALLVVATLCVTVAFQAIIDLPSHIFPDAEKRNIQILYLAANWALLSSAMFVIEYLTSDMPFKWELKVASLSWWTACGSSVAGTQLPYGIKVGLYLAPAFLKYGLRFFPQLLARVRRPNNGSPTDQQAPPP